MQELEEPRCDHLGASRFPETRLGAASSALNKKEVVRKALLKRVIVGRHPGRTFIRAAAMAVVCFVVFRYFLIPVRVYGISMEPTYRDGSINFVNALSFCFREPQRGEVVGIAMAGRHVMLLKRIIGLPEETVAFIAGGFVINGKALEEPYLRTGCEWVADEVKNGHHEYFVAGDNREVSFSSYTAGRVNRNKIVGAVLF